MKTRYNFTYKIPFKLAGRFNWHEQTNTVNLSGYAKPILGNLPRVCNNLVNTNSSRQEVIVINDQPNNNSCLISIQFQIVGNAITKHLLVIANYRSQCKINGRPIDTKMLESVATEAMYLTGLNYYEIIVNVANYHRNETLTLENKLRLINIIK